MLFQKGQSGNPGGRPKLDPKIKKALVKATPMAIEALVSILKDATAKHADKVKAAEIILDKVLGKNPLEIESKDEVIIIGMPQKPSN